MNYKTYMLRVWKHDEQQAPKVRFSIENVRTGTRIGFTELESLLTYLDGEAEEAPNSKQS